MFEQDWIGHIQNLGHAKVRNSNTSFELTTLFESTAEGQELQPHSMFDGFRL